MKGPNQLNFSLNILLSHWKSFYNVLCARINACYVLKQRPRLPMSTASAFHQFHQALTQLMLPESLVGAPPPPSQHPVASSRSQTGFTGVTLHK